MTYHLLPLAKSQISELWEYQSLWYHDAKGSDAPMHDTLILLLSACNSIMVDNVLIIIMFDISADWPQNAKFCTRNH